MNIRGFEECRRLLFSSHTVTRGFRWQGSFNSLWSYSELNLMVPRINSPARECLIDYPIWSSVAEEPEVEEEEQARQVAPRRVESSREDDDGATGQNEMTRSLSWPINASN